MRLCWCLLEEKLQGGQPFPNNLVTGCRHCVPTPDEGHVVRSSAHGLQLLNHDHTLQRIVGFAKGPAHTHLHVLKTFLHSALLFHMMNMNGQHTLPQVRPVCGDVDFHAEKPVQQKHEGAGSGHALQVTQGEWRQRLASNLVIPKIWQVHWGQGMLQNQQGTCFCSSCVKAIDQVLLQKL